MTKRWSRFWVFGQSENGKRKNLLTERHGETNMRGDKSSIFILKKARILVHLQLYLTSLRTRVVSLETWILQIMVWSISTWETSWGCMCHTERQRIRTATKFVGPSAGHSESSFCSSVTRVSDFILLQASHSPLTITVETLCLSIAGEKCTVTSRQHTVTWSCPPSLPACYVMWDLMSVVLRKQVRNRIIWIFPL